MRKCPFCSTGLPESAAFCPKCGSGLGESSATPTRVAASPASSSFAPTTPIDGARFAAGAILAGRYRVVGLLGKGGMGEVYRADDLTLGQAVALKFLPTALARDPDRLSRFHGEVRIARQVSHPNVCRMYDIGEADGMKFLSMEFVDGEDLSSLLRRIGRLPGDKAVEIGRQLCAGLAAAHDKGVVHRDLKPANVMIDSRGKVRITDFGLASLAGDLSGAELRAGTPKYMAPEQLAGSEVTARSDLYALGLILYEVSTGKEAFSARTLEEVRSARAATAPTAPSSVIPEMDPALERVIMRCLEKEPRDRPVSALAVAASLPGGDPLAAALAAGETPSPEMVAASGEAVSVRPATGLACIAAIVLCLAVAGLMSRKAMLPLMVPLDKPPSVLVDRAVQVVRKLGYEDPPADDSHGFGTYVSYLRHLAAHDETASRWDRLASERPEAIYFEYRQSPRYLDDEDSAVLSGRIELRLDARGLLREFSAVPLQVEKQGEVVKEMDWSIAFGEAGLDMNAFSATEPAWLPPAFADTRKAWVGTYPGQPQTKLRVEGASYRGRPVSFQVLDEWTRASRISPLPPTPAAELGQGFTVVLLLLGLCAGVLLARYNLKMGRGDQRGALKVALYALVCHLLMWSLNAHHFPSVTREWGVFSKAVAESLFSAAQIWLIYVALEPYVRRRWPETLISWSRMLAGRWADPMVGRDLLAGVTIGVGCALTDLLAINAHTWLGEAPPLPFWRLIDGMLSFRRFTASLLDIQLDAIFISMVLLFFLVGVFILVRRRWLAVGLVFSIPVLVGLSTSEGGVLWINLVASAVTAGLMAFALLRYGLLAMMVVLFVAQWLEAYPLAIDPAAWWAAGTYVTLLLPVLLAVYGFRAGLAGQPLFKAAKFRE